MIHINGYNVTQDPERFGMWKVQKEGSFSLATAYYFNDKVEAMEFAEAGGFKDQSQQGLDL